MTLEALVALTCIGAPSGCDEVAKLYYGHRPGLKRQVKAVRRQVKATLGREIVWAIPVAYAAVSERTTQIRLRKSLILRISTNEVILVWKKEF